LLVEEAIGAASLPPQCRSGDGLADCRGRHRIGRLRGTSAKIEVVEAARGQMQ